MKEKSEAAVRHTSLAFAPPGGELGDTMFGSGPNPVCLVMPCFLLHLQR